MPRQPCRELFQPSFVGKRNECPANGYDIGHPILPDLTRAPELPADLTAERRDFADHCKLQRRLRLTATVDPDAVLDRQHSSAAPEVPRRRTLGAEDCPHA